MKNKFLALLKGPETMTKRVFLSTLGIPVLVYKYHFPWKGTKALWKEFGTDSGARKAQDATRTCNINKGTIWSLLGHVQRMQKDRQG
jgi:hypothetical protein